MAAFSRADEVTIPRTPAEGVAWGWEPHETVTLKGKFTIGDASASSTVNVSKGESGPQVNTTPDVVVTMARMITRWNLTDEQNRVAELNERNIALLPMNYFNPIIDEIGVITKRGEVSDPLPLSSGVNEPTFQN
jgi:hypothetical protein